MTKDEYTELMRLLASIRYNTVEEMTKCFLSGVYENELHKINEVISTLQNPVFNGGRND